MDVVAPPFLRKSPRGLFEITTANEGVKPHVDW